jgi:hypothetical protein
MSNYRDISINEHNKQGVGTMGILIPLGIVVVWIILQVWVLPRFGVKT